MICNNILEAVGNTPVIRLNHMTGPDDAEVLVKYEGLNIGGSVKTRTALRMIEAAEKEGKLRPGSVECIDRCIEEAKRMAAEDPNVFMPDQFSNPENICAHTNGTALEILEQIDGPIDGFCSGIGTGGTITGIGKVLKEKNPDMLIWAAEPEHAAILSGGSIGSHLQMGIGDGLIPPILDRGIISGIEIVTDDEAISTTLDLGKKEGILCGISSGTNVCVALRMAKLLGKGKRVVTILPDTGERYFSTELFER